MTDHRDLTPEELDELFHPKPREPHTGDLTAEELHALFRPDLNEPKPKPGGLTVEEWESALHPEAFRDRARAAAARALALANVAADLARSTRPVVSETGTDWDAHRAALGAAAKDLAALANRAERDIRESNERFQSFHPSPEPDRSGSEPKQD